MTPAETKAQTIQAYKQHKDIWTKYAKESAKYRMKSFNDLALTGIGRAIVSVANGYSFEEQIEILKKHKNNVDFIACDKTMGHLLDHGITPTYVVVCDSRVNFEKYMAPWKDKLKDTILIQNVCASPTWADNGNWKDRYFFVNMDVMHYEREFVEYSGCKNLVTAGTNVSNMMVVLLTQCNNEQRRNLMGYDKIILCGYDYSWRSDGKYYAFDDTGSGKKYYMRHVYGLSSTGKMLYTSNNLVSSASWLNDYVRAFKIPIVQCSPDSVGDFGQKGDLEENIKYRFKAADREVIKQELLKRNHLAQQMKKIDDKLKYISQEHYYQHLATV